MTSYRRMLSRPTQFPIKSSVLVIILLNFYAIGVKKISPIRRARPDEDRPRRPQIDRRLQADILRQARQPVFDPPPPADVRPEQARPRIVLDAENYETARLLMMTSTERRPGQIAWDDLLNFFRASKQLLAKILTSPGRNVRHMRGLYHCLS